MARITELKAGRRESVVQLFLDGEYAFSISAELVALRGLRTGMELDTAGAARLEREAIRGRVAEAAWRLLAVRPRSRSELRQRLLRKGLPEQAIEEQLQHLEQQGYLDDAGFAHSWVAMRQSSGSPRGTAALRAELRRKGIDAELAKEAAGESDDAAAALRAASKRAATLRSLPYPDFRKRLFGFLQRRGFGYETARTAVDAAWQQYSGDVPDEFEGMI